MDHFFLRPEQRTKERLQETGGNVDYERFFKEIIIGLQHNTSFSYRVFDCSKMSFDKTVTVYPKQLNVIEGAYSMHHSLMQCYDFKIFLQIGKDEQCRRIFSRNGPAMLQRFLDEWIPLENRYFQEMNIPEKSDLILYAHFE